MCTSVNTAKSENMNKNTELELVCGEEGCLIPVKETEEERIERRAKELLIELITEMFEGYGKKKEDTK